MQPQGWTDDELSAFLEDAHQASYATFVRRPTEYGRLRIIDDAFRRVVGAVEIDQVDKLVPSMLMLRCHANFLGAVRLAISTQIAEAYMVIRGCLESALYAHHFSIDPDAAALYWTRHDGEKARRDFRKGFPSYGAMRDALAAADPDTGQALSRLYEAAIDFGAHPNPFMLVSNSFQESGTMGQTYLNPDGDQFDVCLKICAGAGMCGLRIFRRLYPDKFDSVLTQELSDLSRQL